MPAFLRLVLREHHNIDMWPEEHARTNAKLQGHYYKSVFARNHLNPFETYKNKYSVTWHALQTNF